MLSTCSASCQIFLCFCVVLGGTCSQWFQRMRHVKATTLSIGLVLVTLVTWSCCVLVLVSSRNNAENGSRIPFKIYSMILDQFNAWPDLGRGRQRSSHCPVNRSIEHSQSTQNCFPLTSFNHSKDLHPNLLTMMTNAIPGRFSRHLLSMPRLQCLHHFPIERSQTSKRSPFLQETASISSSQFASTCLTWKVKLHEPSLLFCLAFPRGLRLLWVCASASCLSPLQATFVYICLYLRFAFMKCSGLNHVQLCSIASEKLTLRSEEADWASRMTWNDKPDSAKWHKYYQYISFQEILVQF